MPRIRIPTARLRLPDPPVGPPRAPAGYPETLEDRFAIARHIVNLATGNIDEEMVEEYYAGARGVLRFVPMAEIREGPAENNIRSVAKEKRYAKMPPQTLPPLVIQNGEIEDGGHRYRVAKAAGAMGMWCYDIQDA